MRNQLLTSINSLEEKASYWRGECDSSDESQSSYARGELHCIEYDIKVLREALRILFIRI